MEESAPLQASGPNHSFGAALKDIPMKFSPLLDEMMKALQVLPGVGPKSAQRMAFTLLERERMNQNNFNVQSERRRLCGSCQSH